MQKALPCHAAILTHTPCWHLPSMEPWCVGGLWDSGVVGMLSRRRCFTSSENVRWSNRRFRGRCAVARSSLERADCGEAEAGPGDEDAPPQSDWKQKQSLMSYKGKHLMSIARENTIVSLQNCIQICISNLYIHFKIGAVGFKLPCYLWLCLHRIC